MVENSLLVGKLARLPGNGLDSPVLIRNGPQSVVGVLGQPPILDSILVGNFLPTYDAARRGYLVEAAGGGAPVLAQGLPLPAQGNAASAVQSRPRQPPAAGPPGPG